MRWDLWFYIHRRNLLLEGTFEHLFLLKEHTIARSIMWVGVHVTTTGVFHVHECSYQNVILWDLR